MENIEATPNWQLFEKIVTQIHKTLSPKATVTHNDKILGQDSQQQRQIDVSIRQHTGPYPILIIIQCRYYRNKIDLNDVEQFLGVVNDVRANAGVIVSNAGFTDGAIALAKNRSIQLCSVFDAENKDWSIWIKLPVICDFRAPIMRARFKGKTTRDVIDKLKSNLNDVEIVRSNGQTVTLRQLFLEDWNSGKVKAETGEHEHKPSDAGLRIRSADGRLWSMDVTFDVEVRSRLFFGYVGLEKSAGIVNVTEHSYTTKEMILEWIDVVAVENEWQRIPTLEAAPQKPFMVLVALDSFPEKGEMVPC